MSAPMIDKVNIRSNGQITIPKEARERLGVDDGSQVTLIYEDDRVIMMNPNIYAMKAFQEEMKGEAEKAGLTTEEDIIRLCREVRAEVEGL
jgi:AbrB family looped-hinge helix DNA binding protein